MLVVWAPSLRRRRPGMAGCAALPARHRHADRADAQVRRATRGGQATLAERMKLLTEHDARVEGRIALLQAQRKHLQEKIDWYRKQLPVTAHPDRPFRPRV